VTVSATYEPDHAPVRPLPGPAERYPAKSFDDLGYFEYAFVVLDTVPYRIRMDYARRNANVALRAWLCGRCDGTGNDLYAMWHKCSRCGGLGLAPVEDVAAADNG